jgi:hypothetical protein
MTLCDFPGTWAIEAAAGTTWHSSQLRRAHRALEKIVIFWVPAGGFMVSWVGWSVRSWIDGFMVSMTVAELVICLARGFFIFRKGQGAAFFDFALALSSPPLCIPSRAAKLPLQRYDPV